MPNNRRARLICTPALVLCPGLTLAQSPTDTDLAPYFGWDPMEVMAIDDGFGPVCAADMNGDGRNDIVVANNRKSRLEIYLQRATKPTEDENDSRRDVNELPLLWRFERATVPLSTRVTGLAVHDFNADGLPDLILGGSPDEVILMAQKRPGTYEVAARRGATGLRAGRSGFLLANLSGDASPELVALADKEIRLYPIEKNAVGQPVAVPVSDGVVACFVEDFDGDGFGDLMAVAPNDPSPVRLWRQLPSSVSASTTELGPEIRFELPALRELEPVRLPNRPAACFVTIEQASKRIVLHDLTSQSVDIRTAGVLRALDQEVDAPLAVHAYPNLGNAKPSLAVADGDGDGLLDVLVTNPDSNTLLWYRQEQGRGLAEPVSFPTLASPSALAVASVDADAPAEVFVLSQEEKVVGRSDFAGMELPFPSSLPAPNDLVTLALVPLDSPALAVITKDKREHTLRLISMDGAVVKDIPLGALARSPETILPWDADQDGRMDILLLTKDEPMILLQQQEGGAFAKKTKDDMGQYGLVAAANGANAALMDVTGDGTPELMLADRNYVRALRFEPARATSPGWQVVDQFNLADARSKLSALTSISTGGLVVYDSAGKRLALLEGKRDQAAPGTATRWSEVGSLRLRGFAPVALTAGAFTGDGTESILCSGADGFAVVQLGGQRLVLSEVASYRADKEDRLEHEISTGDVNGDGYADLVVLDAGEQALEVFTVSKARRMLPANEFRVFQTRLFEGGDQREFEPHDCLIADVTGDGAVDLLVQVHDRILIYPQARAGSQR